MNYLKARAPEYLSEYQKILQIRVSAKKETCIGHLFPAQVKELLAAPNSNTDYGFRDAVLLSLLYDSGSRVQELCDLRVKDLHLTIPYAVNLTGKGNKSRAVPLMKETSLLLKTYIGRYGLSDSSTMEDPLFYNHQHQKLTRAGVTYILKKYCQEIQAKNSAFPTAVSPHMLRHSKAMHLLQAGVNLIYIRDFLGHTQIATTEIYARADSEMKRKAIEASSPKIVIELPDWRNDESLMAMLVDLCK